jgi:fermentation-respiration switch protein FrsA (DUF1100 family)
MPPNDTTTAPSSVIAASAPNASTARRLGAWPSRAVATLLIVAGFLTFTYAATSVYLATQLVTLHGRTLDSHTPAEYGLGYQEVAFSSREDHLQLHGWFIPGVLPSGRLTTYRALIVMHGHGGDRDDPSIKLLSLVSDLAHHGFAVLTFDARNSGQSAAGADGVGYFEYRDALGAYDFLTSGDIAYPALGRPHVIGGWGISMGAASMIHAVAVEPGIKALVSDSAFADLAPILEREIPKAVSKLAPPLAPVVPALVPGTLLAADAIYGLNQYANRPVDYVASIAPRPLFFIHGDHDDYTPSSMEDQLVAAASTPLNAHVTYWKVAGIFHHAQNYPKYPAIYVQRVTDFYTESLGADPGQPA